MSRNIAESPCNSFCFSTNCEELQWEHSLSDYILYTVHRIYLYDYNKEVKLAWKKYWCPDWEHFFAIIKLFVWLPAEILSDIFDYSV